MVYTDHYFPPSVCEGRWEATDEMKAACICTMFPHARLMVLNLGHLSSPRPPSGLDQGSSLTGRKGASRYFYDRQEKLPEKLHELP